MNAKPTIYTQSLIELTDFCNLNCSMCSRVMTGKSHMHPGKNTSFINQNTIKNTFNGLYNFWSTPLAVKLFWCGEPLLHPEFDKIIQSAAKFCSRENAYLDLHTNAVFLDRYIDLLLESGDVLPRMTFSIDAINSKTYCKIRTGGNLETVMDNIGFFLKQRKELGLQWPKIVIQFIVLQDNKSECLQFVKFWYKKLTEYDTGGPDMDTIWVKKGDAYTPELQEFHDDLFRNCLNEINKSKNTFDSSRVRLIANSENSWPNKEDTYEIPDLQLHCGAPFTSPVIDSRGNLTCCCLDSSLDLSPGNINDNNFKTLWFSKSLQNIRKAFIQQDTENYPEICRNCPGYSGNLFKSFIKQVYSM